MADKKKRPPGWHGGRKKTSGKTTYEGTQYRGGRGSGRKNLKRTDDGKLVNQHGVTFTKEEKRALENAVNRVNYRRTKMMEEEGKLPRIVNGKQQGTVRELQLMGKESDFIISRRTKSLQRFKSKEDYKEYLRDLDKVMSPNYVTERIRDYKRNHITALDNAFGDDAKDVKMKLRMMKPDEYMKLIQSNEDLEISYIYDPADRSAKLNQIRKALGMKIKDDDEVTDEAYD